MPDYILLAAAAFLAGLIDAVVGGGGLIQIPALFSVLPNAAPASLLGTSKLAGRVWYRQRRAAFFAPHPAGMEYRGAGGLDRICVCFCRCLYRDPGAAGFHPQDAAFHLAGRGTVYLQEKGFWQPCMRRCIPARRKSWWRCWSVPASVFMTAFSDRAPAASWCSCSCGFFGFNFLGASAIAKVVNVACNISALIWFGYSGHLLWQVGLVMAVFNVGGSLVGSRLAIRHGSGFVRKIFLLVVALLIVKTGYDAFLK